MAVDLNHVFTKAEFVANMQDTDRKNGLPIGTTQKKLFNMDAMASFSAMDRNWTIEAIKTAMDELPADKYLDQTKTSIVDNFVWSSMLYPNSTNPNLDGESVLVFAIANAQTVTTPGVDGADPTVTQEVQYSFISLKKLVDIYEAKNTDTKGVTVAVTAEEGKKVISAELNISADADNQADLRADGLYVAKYDDTAIKGRVSTLETTVGKPAGTDNEGNPTPATGLVAEVAANKAAIGEAPTKDSNGDISTPGSGLLAAVDKNATDIAANKAAIGVAPTKDEQGNITVAGSGILADIDKIATDLASLGGTGGSVATQIKTAIEDLDATVTNEVQGAAATAQPDVIVTVEEEDGKLKSVVASVSEKRFDSYGTASGLVGQKKIDADPENGVTGQAATGVYAYIDDKTNFDFATEQDILGLFAI